LAPPGDIVALLINFRYYLFMFEGCLYFNTTALARAVEKGWSQAYRRFDLTPAQAFCLRALIAHPGSKPSALAEILGISRPTATRMLDQLERKRLAVRQASAEDNRESIVMPTRKALTAAAGIERASAEMTAKMKTALGDEEFHKVVTRLKSARAFLE